MTEKLYYHDSFMTGFTAAVLSCEQGKEGWQVVLDRTAFYPEGGGQPADHGTLGDARVTDVREKNGVILHTCDKVLAAGETVTGKIDWARRFDHMQQHSGEHIVSGMLCGTYHCDNTGFHMGEGSVIIDYNADIPWEGVLEIESRANHYIWENHPFEALYPSAEELKSLPYRSKKELNGQVRITRFPGADCCACCGTHVLTSGQVGLVKFFSCQKFREGVRIEMLCGERAFRALSTSWEQNRMVSQMLSVKPDQTKNAVVRLQTELQNVKFHSARLEEAAYASMAEKHAGAGDVLLIQPPMEPDAARRLADAVAKASGGLSAVFAGEDGGKYNYALVRADGGDISAFVKSMNGALHGRGGGRNGFAQGSVEAAKAEIEAFFQK